MSVEEIQTLAQQFADAFNNKNIKAALDMLSKVAASAGESCASTCSRLGRFRT